MKGKKLIIKCFSTSFLGTGVLGATSEQSMLSPLRRTSGNVLAAVHTAVAVLCWQRESVHAVAVGDVPFPNWELMVPFYQIQFSLPPVYVANAFLGILVPSRTMEKLLCASCKTVGF